MSSWRRAAVPKRLPPDGGSQSPDCRWYQKCQFLGPTRTHQVGNSGEGPRSLWCLPPTPSLSLPEAANRAACSAGLGGGNAQLLPALPPTVPSETRYPNPGDLPDPVVPISSLPSPMYLWVPSCGGPQTRWKTRNTGMTHVSTHFGNKGGKRKPKEGRTTRLHAYALRDPQKSCALSLAPATDHPPTRHPAPVSQLHCPVAPLCSLSSGDSDSPRVSLGIGFQSFTTEPERTSGTQGRGLSAPRHPLFAIFPPCFPFPARLSPVTGRPCVHRDQAARRVHCRQLCPGACDPRSGGTGHHVGTGSGKQGQERQCGSMKGTGQAPGPTRRDSPTPRTPGQAWSQNSCP